jgi:NTP pyrophosphatase (non-canonical NTP hydrolase)
MSKSNKWQLLARAIHESVVKRWQPWTVEDRNFLMVALAGEVGEVANIVKKDIRGDFGPDKKQRDYLKAQLADELADSQVYLYLLAEACGVDLDKAVQVKLDFLMLTRYADRQSQVDQFLAEHKP